MQNLDNEYQRKMHRLDQLMEEAKLETEDGRA